MTDAFTQATLDFTKEVRDVAAELLVAGASHPDDCIKRAQAIVLQRRQHRHEQRQKTLAGIKVIEGGRLNG